MKILSFDPATKSLAVSLVEYNSGEKLWREYKEGKYNNLEEKLEAFNTMLEKLLELKRIDIKFFEVKDLIPSKRVKDLGVVDRSRALYDYLVSLDHLVEPGVLILIEYQMGPNHKSGQIAHQIMYHYQKFPNVVKVIGPSLKNQLYIGDDGKYANFIRKYKTNYTANKKHTTYNFNKLLGYLGMELKLKKMDDIADSVLMGAAYFRKYA